MAPRHCRTLLAAFVAANALAALAVRWAGSGVGAGSGAGAGVGSGAAAAAAAAAEWFPWRCPLRLCTGIACPTCGMGRGLLAWVAGDWRGAASAHPLAPVLPFVVGLALAAGWLRPEAMTAVMRALRGRRITAAFVVVAVVFGIVRA